MQGLSVPGDHNAHACMHQGRAASCLQRRAAFQHSSRAPRWPPSARHFDCLLQPSICYLSQSFSAAPRCTSHISSNLSHLQAESLLLRCRCCQRLCLMHSSSELEFLFILRLTYTRPYSTLAGAGSDAAAHGSSSGACRHRESAVPGAQSGGGCSGQCWLHTAAPCHCFGP